MFLYDMSYSDKFWQNSASIAFNGCNQFNVNAAESCHALVGNYELQKNLNSLTKLVQSGTAESTPLQVEHALFGHGQYEEKR